MSKIFMTSDLHLGHNNIVKNITNWKITYDFQVRDFDSLEEHDSAIIDNINEYVGQDDTLYILGDFSFKPPEKIKEYRKRIVCDNIHYIYGNHDKHIVRNKMGLQDLFNSCQYYLEVTLRHPDTGEKIPVVMSHYAMRTWNRAHHGSFQLHGHSHSRLEQPEVETEVDKHFNKLATMDVGVDNINRIYGEYRPISWGKVARRLSDRPSLDRKRG